MRGIPAKPWIHALPYLPAGRHRTAAVQLAGGRRGGHCPAERCPQCWRGGGLRAAPRTHAHRLHHSSKHGPSLGVSSEPTPFQLPGDDTFMQSLLMWHSPHQFFSVTKEKLTLSTRSSSAGVNVMRQNGDGKSPVTQQSTFHYKKGSCLQLLCKNIGMPVVLSLKWRIAREWYSLWLPNERQLKLQPKAQKLFLL